MSSEIQTWLDGVPKAYADRFLAVVGLTDSFCDAHLNEAYRKFCRDLAVAVCQEGSPVLRGKVESWAAGVVYTLGRVNFLTDPSQSPHLTSKEIAAGIGVSMATMQAKYKIIWDALDLMPMHPDWTLPSLIDDNLLVWILKVNGLMMDIRVAPRDAQVVAYEQGLIPYIPADRKAGEAEMPQADRLFELEVALLSGPLSEAFAEANPAISRTLVVRGHQTLEDLHEAIFDAFDRIEAHLYEFQVGGEGPMDPRARRYGLPMAMGDPDADQPLGGDVTRTPLGSLGLEVDQAFGYWFDFGDDWWHQVTVLAIHDKVPRGRYPKLTEKIGESPPQYLDDGEADQRVI